MIASFANIAFVALLAGVVSASAEQSTGELGVVGRSISRAEGRDQTPAPSAVRLAQTAPKTVKRAPVDPHEPGLVQSVIVNTVPTLGATANASVAPATKQAQASPATSSTSVAQDMNEPGAQALQVIDLGTKCPLPNEPTPAGDQHVINHFKGTKTTFDLIAEEDHSYRDIAARVGTTERYSAKWSDFNSVYVSKIKNRVWLFCRVEDCMRYTEHHTYGWVGVFKDIEMSLSGLRINFCDRATATNVWAAISFLVKLNGGKLIKTKSDNDEWRDED